MGSDPYQPFRVHLDLNAAMPTCTCMHAATSTTALRAPLRSCPPATSALCALPPRRGKFGASVQCKNQHDLLKVHHIYKSSGNIKCYNQQNLAHLQSAIAQVAILLGAQALISMAALCNA